MGRPKLDYTNTVCKSCPVVGGRRINEQCAKCYRRDYYHNRTRRVTIAAERSRKTREWREKNPERWAELVKRHNTKDKWFLWRYGITHEKYLEFRTAQNGICALCHKDAKRLVLDHNHETGRLRKFLCDRCNMFVGWVEKTGVAFVHEVVDYLSKHNTQG